MQLQKEKVFFLIPYNGSWYYCNSSIAMMHETVIDGYKLGIDGAWTN